MHFRVSTERGDLQHHYVDYENEVLLTDEQCIFTGV
jgi:hypothetical protein